MERVRRILGIGGALGHDSNAALLIDGELIAASQEERFTRIKHDGTFPHHAICDCLNIAGIEPNDVDVCVLAEKPLQFQIADSVKKPTNPFTWKLSEWIGPRRVMYQNDARELFPRARLHFAWHHLSHAAAAFVASPFERAAFLCVDGRGEDSCASIGVVHPRRTEILYELPWVNGLGMLYELVTNYLGFLSQGSEYKVMGLAPYGHPIFKESLRALTQSNGEGALRLEHKLALHPESWEAGTEMLAQYLGLPVRYKDDPLSDDHVNVAASLQALFEEELLKMAHMARRVTGERDLLFCGGCAQNCVAASQIRRAGIFDRMFNSPIGGDMGNAFGAAVLADWHYRDSATGRVDVNGFYLGSEPGDAPAEALPNRIPIDGDIHSTTAKLLAEGKVVGWVRGRMELGARALGARSILASPLVPNMQSILNLKVKFRESFRPFAPAIIADECGAWFDTEEPSDFMQYTAYLQPSRRRPMPANLGGLRERLDFQRCNVPSVVHVDYSARLQTVRESVHPDLYRLIRCFQKITGIPMVINTSFNVTGQPIVRTAQDAWTCFRHTDMDYLVLNDDIYRNPNDTTAEEKRRWSGQFATYS